MARGVTAERLPLVETDVTGARAGVRAAATSGADRNDVDCEREDTTLRGELCSWLPVALPDRLLASAWLLLGGAAGTAVVVRPRSIPAETDRVKGFDAAADAVPVAAALRAVEGVVGRSAGCTPVPGAAVALVGRASVVVSGRRAGVADAVVAADRTDDTELLRAVREPTPAVEREVARDPTSSEAEGEAVTVPAAEAGRCNVGTLLVLVLRLEVAAVAGRPGGVTCVAALLVVAPPARSVADVLRRVAAVLTGVKATVTAPTVPPGCSTT